MGRPQPLAWGLVALMTWGRVPRSVLGQREDRTGGFVVGTLLSLEAQSVVWTGGRSVSAGATPTYLGEWGGVPQRPLERGDRSVRAEEAAPGQGSWPGPSPQQRPPGLLPLPQSHLLSLDSQQLGHQVAGRTRWASAPAAPASLCGGQGLSWGSALGPCPQSPRRMRLSRRVGGREAARGAEALREDSGSASLV